MAHGRRTDPYGSWTSPIGAADVARGEALPEWVGFVGDEVWWTEPLPEEGGRAALMRGGPDGPVEALPGRWDVRSRVIEYGGRPWAAVSADPADGVVFTHGPDQRLYRWRPGTEPVPLTPPGGRPAELRYADFTVRGDEVWSMRETVADPEGTRVTRHLVAVPLDGTAAGDPGRVRVLAASHHFLTGPRVEPGGDRVAWLGWNHPDMPWDATELMVADITPAGELAAPRVVLGDLSAPEPRLSVTQAEWAADGSGTLYAVSDPEGWWNVHAIGADGTVRGLRPAAEEFGDALWRIGQRWCVPLRDGTLAVVHGTGERRLGILSPDGGLRDPDGFTEAGTEWSSPATDGRRIAAVCAGPRRRRTVVVADPADGRVTVVRPPSGTAFDAWAPTPYTRSFDGADGQEVHAHVYPPYSPGHTGPEGELPPWLIFVHGGPTSRSARVLRQDIGFFTSRGIGVVDVQYGGSSGYGRAYRERLRGNWGITDVRDCAAVARGLVAQGLADPARIAVRGGSAGGWTAAASLCAEPDLYGAAALYFPLLDPVTWAKGGTHDFESRYLDSLIGPWPEAEERYQERSPLAGADRIRTPFVLFQGMEDKVCPPEQSRATAERLAGRGVDCRYLTFEEEGHGFRRAENIVTALHAELELYGEAFGFTPAP
ncbi:alpha/beta hydrolase family protein [Streptomyces chilikensis]|uniref:Prolyl oligopeptidase family serine peptidase n=1 Tax=Streptomyces chilikensis TaxID=1194079 RepID=A0ABV3ETQ7_9ACTN